MTDRNKKLYKELMNKKISLYTEQDCKDFNRLQSELSKQGLTSDEVDQLIEEK